MSDLSAGPRIAIPDLLAEFDTARAYTESLYADLKSDEVFWRPHENSSAIGWHLGHQAAVTHFMVRNLTAAEASLDPELDRLMDAATAESARGQLPVLDRIRDYRAAAADRLHVRMTDIVEGRVGAPQQLSHIAVGLIVAVTNHEYQHSQWIGEVRHQDLGHALPERPTSELICEIDGYLMVG